VTEGEVTLSELKWRCRRGMLELDVFLQRFLQQGYAELSGEQRQVFLELLEYPDQELLELLLGRIHAVEPAHNEMAERIRAGASVR
jgi:antitoxin CptB